MLLSNRSADGSSVAGVIRRAFCAGAPQNTRAGNRANGELPFPAKQMRSGLEYSMASRKTAATKKSSTAAAKKTPAKTKAGTRAVRKAPAQPADKRVFISNDDAYWYGNGTHYQIYKKLGAHLSEENGEKGVFFAVWAPNAKAVHVVGTFNGWNEGPACHDPVQCRRHLDPVHSRHWRR